MEYDACRRNMLCAVFRYCKKIFQLFAFTKSVDMLALRDGDRTNIRDYIQYHIKNECVGLQPRTI